MAWGCGDSGGPGSLVTVKAMTRNVYVGADIEKILLAPTPQELVAAVETAYQELIAANFPERAEVLAAEISAAKPHVVGLQEISLLRQQSPGDAAIGGTIPATDTVLDYLQLVLDELAALGESYTMVAKVENFDFEAPRANLDDVRLTDFDVLLVRSELATANAATGNYELRLTPILSGEFIDIWRGWVAADVTIDGTTFRVVNTHLESATASVRLAQAVELIGLLESVTNPVIIVGDLNTDAIAGTDPAYGQFTGNGGYQDTWTLSDAAGQGLSCCHLPDLKNATSTFGQRIDFVMVKNVTKLVSVTGKVIGTDPAKKTVTDGLWPSDHGGVVVEMVVTP